MHLVPLDHFPGVHGYTRADRGTVAPCADQLEQDAVIAAIVAVHQYGGRSVHVQDHVNVAIIRDVAKGGATP